MEMDYSRRAEDAHMARLVQHDISHKKGDNGGASYKKLQKAWTRFADGRPEKNDGDDFAAAMGGRPR